MNLHSKENELLENTAAFSTRILYSMSKEDMQAWVPLLLKFKGAAYAFINTLLLIHFLV